MLFLWHWTSVLGRTLRRGLLNLVTRPTSDSHKIRLFRFGIPWIVKVSARVRSTEADALKFLNATGLPLPIPRLIYSFMEEGFTYTIMTRMPGDVLVLQDTTPQQLRMILSEVFAVIEQIQTLRQPDDIAGQVMMTTAGHELPDPQDFFETRIGPFPSILDLWAYCAGYFGAIDTFVEDVGSTVRDALLADPIRFVHTDLRMYNVLVKDGHVSEIIDWEDSGWLPSSFQVHVMRRPTIGSHADWLLYWRDEHRFSDEAEAAYEASKTFLEKYPM
ncbi:hypothetical protein AGABI2DRAFT_122485 [Agaricus bisporus var. bisporus H97]|uniref:hypothetical protein n=1 Tax=Agaricus bisporus var. bisporus (strain H97 / ATCC MYA-4626 / FGSC 10389) TaxID=936046 RepID=UPI00029F6D86|nr:hypothetical protein AGABI2DRAFT_122485 [Agaricus bisporus var. bisporus H97]EKV42914.1 hypothetical protein AGABI2DRAFT_122485 [Agaricus bisporus var. bisporus H97]